MPSLADNMLGYDAMAHVRLIQRAAFFGGSLNGGNLVVLLGILFYAVLIICAGVFFSFWGGIALVLAIPLVVLIADGVDRKSWPWER